MDDVQLLTTLQEVEGIDDAETALLKTYKRQLHEIGEKNAPHRNTVFHCAGVPFTRSLGELDWTAQLYYCLLIHLPSGVKIFDAYNHRKRFKSMQEIFSLVEGSSLYFFCAVPDFVAQEKGKGSPSSSSAAGGIMHVGETSAEESLE